MQLSMVVAILITGAGAESAQTGTRALLTYSSNRNMNVFLLTERATENQMV